MKTVSFLISLLLVLNSFGQKNDSRIVLNKGQKFKVSTTSSQEADMGMGMEMKNFTSSTNTLTVIDADEKSYTLTNTLTGVKLSMELMGQQTTYDSDKKEDSASEIGKSMQNLNVPDTFWLNKSTATITANKKVVAEAKDDAANPLEGLFESLGKNEDSAAGDAFFLLPKGKKVGDSWTDTSSSKGMKSSKTYRIESIEKNIAKINIAGTVESNIQTEVQGIPVTIIMTTKTNSDVLVDTKSSLVSKRETKADITGNLELMGQSAPITGKATTTTLYEY